MDDHASWIFLKLDDGGAPFLDHVPSNASDSVVSNVCMNLISEKNRCCA